MRHICVVTQSAAFASSAGMRIRYERFIEGAAEEEYEISVHPIGELIEGGAPLDHDAYVFCKTFTTEALLLAAALRRDGRRIGQDLFDDYFSQYDDQRLFQYREWLRQMAPFTDFAICTTPAMQEVLRPYLDCPIAIVEDPVIGYDPIHVAAVTERKAARLARSEELRLVWFGIGDNPFFPVGIDDLTAPPTRGAIARLQALGWKTSLTVVTNDRALDARGLERLRALPTAIDLVEWSEAAEQVALRAADVALLPVSAQGFSRAKSLNRALTTLNHGCQVLSIGEPLYARLDAFLYRSVDALDADLRAGRPKVRSDTVGDLTRMLGDIANAFDASRAFAAAALDLPAGPLNDRRSLAVIHGRESSSGVRALAMRLRALSIRSPFSAVGGHFPVRFDVEGGRLVARIALANAADLGLADRASGPAVTIGAAEFLSVSFEALGLPPVFLAGVAGHPLADTADYAAAMAAIVRACAILFPDHVPIVSDSSPYRTSPGIAA